MALRLLSHIGMSSPKFSFMKGKYYSFQDILSRGVRLSVVAIRRKRGRSYRLYREAKRMSHFWIEGPFGPRGKVLYLYLADSPLTQKVKNTIGGVDFWDSSSDGQVSRGIDYWNNSYPAYARLDRELQSRDQNDLFNSVLKYSLASLTIFFILFIYLLMPY